MFLIGFPLLLIPFAIYNMVAFLTPGVNWTDQVYTVHMVSGANWTITFQDALLGVSIFFLFLELVKATRTGSRSIIDHMLSMVLFVGMLVEFLLVERAATSTFFLLVVIAFVDVLGGFAISVRSARRDVEVEQVAA